MTRIPQTAFREGKVAMFLLQENCNEKLTGFPFRNLLKKPFWKNSFAEKNSLGKTDLHENEYHKQSECVLYRLAH